MKKTILAISIICALALTTTGCNAVSNTKDISTNTISEAQYKSIKKIDKLSTDSKLSAKTILNQMNTATSELKEYLEGNNSKAEKDKLYAVYLNNMYIYNDVLKTNLELDTLHTYPQRERLSFKAEGLNFTYDNLQLYLDESSFDHGLIIMQYMGEGAFGPEFDMYYQAQAFAKYLGKAWNDYLSIRSREALYLKDVAFSMHGPGDYTTVNMYELGIWIKSWSDFLVNNPSFYMNERIKKNLKMYVRYYINPLQNEIDDSTALSKARQIEFEELLEIIDKNSDAYKTLNNAYTMLKSNDFKTNDNYRKFYDKLY